MMSKEDLVKAIEQGEVLARCPKCDTVNNIIDYVLALKNHQEQTGELPSMDEFSIGAECAECGEPFTGLKL